MDDKAKRAAEKKAARKKAREQVAGGNFGDQQAAVEPSSDLSVLPNAVSSDKHNDSHLGDGQSGSVGLQKTQEEEDDVFLEALARGDDLESQTAVAENITVEKEERPRSAKSIKSNVSGRSLSRSTGATQP